MTSSSPEGFFQWVWYLLQQYGSLFVQGTLYTLLIAIVGTIAGCIIGFFVGIVRTIEVNPEDSVVKKVLLKCIQLVLSAYVEFFRGTPMIVQAMVIFYGAMEVFNIDLSPLSAGLIVVSINTGAYMAETVRGGIDSIDEGQTEGAKAIGMTHFQTMLYIVLPQTLRNIMPQIGNNLIINIKDTSVLNVISVTELFFVGKSAAGAYYKYFEVFFIICVIYFVVNLAVSRILRFVEKKMDGPDSYKLITSDYMSGEITENSSVMKLKGGKQ
ncbi:polar amino acid ABC transporter, inner membrane subunit [Clostridium sp. DL-VIII]|uniref:amino acid ABC transporter permease n=1 Tax=Clostridium sp. DL-VIII TaxID=641107 RepID=UPI00023B0706|nr:amino acid ABC transporter permease [Clostridium sp. DL-VIII]EHJ01576.1 polar amino acid ABC transporter, inner membrane subunit [Clostridium sp. DL-VIII]